MKKLMLFILLFALATPTSALIKYDILFTDAEAFVNGTVIMTSEDATDVYELTLTLPEESEVISLADEQPITDYTFNNGKLKFKTNRDRSRFSETINVYYRDLNAVDRTHFPLKKGSISLFGFEDDYTEVNVVANNLIAGTISLGFESNFEEKNTMKGLGLGAANLNIIYGIQDDNTYDHYISLTEADLTKADLMYEMLPALTGYDVPFEKFVVVGLEDSEYSTIVDPWSDGKYEDGGLIFLREKEDNAEQYPTVILHETLHGINNEVLKWDSTEITWFDEGVAKYVEYIVNHEQGLHQAEIFGEEVSYFRGLTKYTHKSRSDPDELWDYYQDNEDFMRTWNPDSDDHRTFGYAFGELVVREYMMTHSADSLHRVYTQLALVDEEITDPDERNKIILDLLESDFKPCYSENREAFDACLRQANTYVPELTTSVDATKSVIDQEKLSEIIQSEEAEIEEAKQRPSNIFEKILNFFADLFA